VRISTVIYSILPHNQLASTRQDGQNYQEDADSAAAIAAISAATNANSEADTILASGAVEGSDAAVAGAVSLAAEDVDTAIFDLAESIELDDKDVAEEVDEVGDGNVEVSGDISDNNNQGDGDGNGNGGVLPM